MKLSNNKEKNFLYNKLKLLYNLEDRLTNILMKDKISLDNCREATNLEELPKRLFKEGILKNEKYYEDIKEDIRSSKYRLSKLCERLLKLDGGNIRLQNVFITQGMELGQQIALNQAELNSAVEIYNCLRKYTLDKFSSEEEEEILEITPLKVKWINNNIFINKIWSESGIGEDIYKELINLWSKAFVTEVNSNFHYKVLENGVKVIENSMSSKDMEVYELDI